MNNQDTVIWVEELHKIYKMGENEVHALRGVTLRVQRGEILAIMGPSGSGKSTLMNILGCLDQPTYGVYVLDGEDVSQMTDDALAAARNKMVGFVFQSFNLLARTSALDNVSLPTVYAGLSRADRKRRAREVLESVGLGDRMDHTPERALRRAAAARGDRAGAGKPAVDHPGRRADGEPRQQERPGGDGDHPAAEPRDGDHRDPGDARPEHYALRTTRGAPL